MPEHSVTSLSGSDDSVIIDALYSLGSSGYDSSDISSDVAIKLINSNNELIRERAVFYFGVKSRDCRFCHNYLDVLVSESPINYPVISACAFAIIATECQFDIIDIAPSVSRYLHNDLTVSTIGTVIVALVFWMANDIQGGELKRMIARGGSPTEDEINRALTILNVAQGRKARL